MSTELESAPVVAPPKPRRKGRLLRFALWMCGGLVVLWIAALLHATWSLNQAIAELKQRGEPATYEEALLVNESRADPRNGVDFIRQALLENERLGRPGDGVSMYSSLSRAPFPSSAVAIVKPLLEKGDSVVALLEQAVALPAGPFTPVSSASKLSQSQREKMIQDVRSLARLLYIDARVSAATGDSRRSFRRLKTLFLFSEQLESETFQIPQLIRCAIVGLGDGAAKFALPLADFSSEELLELSDLAASLERHFKMAPTLMNQRAMEASILLDPEALKEELQSEMMSRNRTVLEANSAFVFFERRWIDLISSSIGLPARRRAAAQTLRIPNDVLELIDVPPPWPTEGQQRYDAWHIRLSAERLRLSSNPYDTMSMAYTAWKRVHRRLAMLQVAFRLRRFQIQHDRLPEKLEELCDATMPILPTKWFEGKPFSYAKNGRSFTLRADPSVAPDLPSPNNSQLEAFGMLFIFDADAGKPTTGGKSSPSSLLDLR